MRLPPFLIAALHACVLAAAAAGGDTLTITASGTFVEDFCFGTTANLDGAHFTWSGTFDADASPVATAPEVSTFEADEVTLTISGGGFWNGVHTPTSLEIKVRDLGFGASVSFLGSFTGGPGVLSLGNLEVEGLSADAAGTPEHRLTCFESSGVVSMENSIGSNGPGFCGYQAQGLDAAGRIHLPQLLITYSGSLTAFAPFPDLALLDGGDFVWSGLFPVDAERSSTDGVDEDSFEGEISLTITGSVGADGVYTPVDNAISEYAAGSTQLRLSSTATFDINGTSVSVGGLIMADGFDNGAPSPSNTLTPVLTEDVDTFTSWTAEVPAPGSGLAIYELTDPQITSVEVHDPWYDACSALAGVDGEPRLVGVGTLAGGSANRILLSHAAPSSIMGLFLAFSNTPVPFKGGTLMPFPVLALLMAATDGDGRVSLPFGIPPGVPAGMELWMQIGISDPAAIYGVALSNAIVGVTP